MDKILERLKTKSHDTVKDSTNGMPIDDELIHKVQKMSKYYQNKYKIEININTLKIYNNKGITSRIVIIRNSIAEERTGAITNPTDGMLANDNEVTR